MAYPGAPITNASRGGAVSYRDDLLCGFHLHPLSRGEPFRAILFLRLVAPPHVRLVVEPSARSFPAGGYCYRGFCPRPADCYPALAARLLIPQMTSTRDRAPGSLSDRPGATDSTPLARLYFGHVVAGSFRFIEPCLPTSADKLPTGPDWVMRSSTMPTA